MYKHTEYDATEPVMLQTIGSHTHSSSNVETESRRAINTMKEKVENSCATLSMREVIASTLQTLDEGVVSRLQTVDSISRNIQNWRKKASGIPALPQGRTGYDLPDSESFTRWFVFLSI